MKEIKVLKGFSDDEIKERNDIVKKIIHELHNWKFASANRLAGELWKGCIQWDTWDSIEKLRNLYGDLGWQEGDVYEPIRLSVYWIAHDLGYKFNRKKQCFEKVNK